MKAYNKDLSYIHDVEFGDFSRQAAAYILQTFRRHELGKGLVVDLGCGSGIWALKLDQSGYEVMGVDISSDMIDLAQKKVPRGKFKVGSFHQVSIPECVAVTSLGECFNYLFDENNSIDLLEALFERIYEALIPGGLLIFDVLEPGSVEAKSSITFRENQDWLVLVEKLGDPKNEQLIRKITTFRKVDDLYRRNQEVHVVKLWKGSLLAEKLRKIGFKVRVLKGYGELRFRKGLIGFKARKPW